jgi:general secretion pathway protein H
MKKQRGFTLLEIILALVIFASCAMMVVTTIPSRRYIWSAIKSPR